MKTFRHVLPFAIACIWLSEAQAETIPFRCGLNPGFTCHYAVYINRGGGGQVRRFTIPAGQVAQIPGISADDLYCVGVIEPPMDPRECTDQHNPWRYHTRYVGKGDGFND